MNPNLAASVVGSVPCARGALPGMTAHFAHLAHLAHLAHFVCFECPPHWARDITRRRSYIPSVGALPIPPLGRVIANELPFSMHVIGPQMIARTFAASDLSIPIAANLYSSCIGGISSQ